jgi:hypothetical protein
MDRFDFPEDYSHTLLEQEEMHFYSCIADVLEAFQTHGIDHVLNEVAKNTVIKQELRRWLDKNGNL